MQRSYSALLDPATIMATRTGRIPVERRDASSPMVLMAPLAQPRAAFRGATGAREYLEGNREKRNLGPTEARALHLRTRKAWSVSIAGGNSDRSLRRTDLSRDVSDHLRWLLLLGREIDLRPIPRLNK